MLFARISVLLSHDCTTVQQKEIRWPSIKTTMTALPKNMYVLRKIHVRFRINTKYVQPFWLSIMTFHTKKSLDQLVTKNQIPNTKLLYLVFCLCRNSKTEETAWPLLFLDCENNK